MMTAPHRTLVVTTAASVVALVAFVAPQATATRTATDFAAGPGVIAWLLAAMPLALAVALLPAGAAGDDHGRRPVFTAGLGLLGVGAALCALAQGPGTFIAGRLVQGLGAAAVLSCGLGLIAAVFAPGPARLRASGVWGASIGAGIATGGLLPVLVEADGGWRTSYAVLAGVCLALGAVAALALPRPAAGVVGVVGGQRRRMDVLGVLTLGAALTCLLSALVRVRTGGGTSVAAIVMLGVAAVALAGAFVLVEARTAHPMLDLHLFTRRDFLAATAAAIANGAGGTALVSYLPTVVQAGLGRSLLVASLLTALFAGTSVLTALQVRRLGVRAPAWVLMAVSLVVLAVAQLTLAGLSVNSGVSRLLPGLALGGVAYGVLNAALGHAAVASVPAERAGVGSGANNTARYLASAVGVTVVALLAPARSTTSASTEAVRAAAAADLVSGWSTAALVTAAVSLTGTAVIIALRPARGDQHTH